MIKYPGIKKNAVIAITQQCPISHSVKVTTPQCFSDLKFLLLCFLFGRDPPFTTIEAHSGVGAI